MDENPPQQNGSGPFVGIVIIVILLALAGVYFFIMQDAQVHQAPPADESQMSA